MLQITPQFVLTFLFQGIGNSKEEIEKRIEETAYEHE